MKRPVVAGLAVALALATLSGCAGPSPSGSPGTPSSPTATVSVIAAPEGTPPRPLLTPTGRSISWGEPTAAGLWPGPDNERDAVQAAISAAAPLLSAIDYTSLALHDFVTVTRAYTPDQTQFDGRGPEMEAYELAGASGSASRGDLAIYRWRGPQLPDHPDRPLVHRWVEVYALYDTKQQRVLNLLASISGEALE